MTKKIIYPRDAHREGLPIRFDSIGMEVIGEPFITLDDGNFIPLKTKSW